jgi:hypothetical protein
MFNYSIKNILLFIFLLSSLIPDAKEINISKSNIIISENIKSPVKETILKVLKEEIAKRSGIKTEITNRWNKPIVLALVLSSDSELINKKLPDKKKLTYKPESFSIVIDENVSQTIIWIIGADESGVLFGIGHFLRNSTFSKNNIIFYCDKDIKSEPDYSIRGHQTGYRNTANSYDAWSKEQYEQYIRDLVIFGTNCIENIPFDSSYSVHMKTSKEEMDRHLSITCKNYGINYWVWTPVNVDISNDSIFKEEVGIHEKYYSNCPYLSDVFVPGGDPGNNHPRYLLPFLKEISEKLKKHHPNAGVWVSLQGFSDEETDFFYNYIETENPDWLRGVVSGPGSPPLSVTRYRLPEKYKHRHYPDITHTVRCQYPAQSWDQAFALTLGREPVNCQPNYYASIHDRYAPFTDGFISYSDGAHDDINKFIWSRKGWDKNENPSEIINQYASYFFCTPKEDFITDAILGLERNWAGPIELNGGIEMTFNRWQQLEKKYGNLKNNWRWQMLVLRAYYDTYIKRRKIYEQSLEKEANKILETVDNNNFEEVMDKALRKIKEADSINIAPELRTKIIRYCESLYQFTGLQTSVEKYGASGTERGCILDFLDYPLNNRWWLSDQFDIISKLDTEEKKIEYLEKIYTWENPGIGSFYDNISNISRSMHVKTVIDDACDVAWWDKGMSRKRLSTQLFQNSPRLVYEDLDPRGRYLIRLTGYGDALLRIDGELVSPTIYNKELEQFKEFPVERKFYQDGKMEITFDEPEESHLNWRQHSKICDIWLIKR